MILALLLGCSDYRVKHTPDDEVGPSETGTPPDTVVTDTSDATTGDSATLDSGPIDTAPLDTAPATCPSLTLGVAGPVSTVAECNPTAPAVTDPWNIAAEWTWRGRGDGPLAMPAVGNLTDDNGDGVINEYDIPDIAFVDTRVDELVVLSGDGSGVVFDVPGYFGYGGVAIADVTGDGLPDVLAFTEDDRMAAVDASGVGEWVSEPIFALFIPEITVADLEGDGTIEVLADTQVLNGADGSMRFDLYHDPGVMTVDTTPIAADLDQDGIDEIILGRTVFDAGGVPLWSDGGSDYEDFAAVADVDGDPGGEVFFTSGDTLTVHDDDGTVLATGTIIGHQGGTISGPPCAADFDGDGQVELGISEGERIGVYEADGTVDWWATTDDSSGAAGCSAYDFDGDGAYEMVFADEHDVYVFDGATGTVRFHTPDHDSQTLWEYPVIADVDRDGSAEIVVGSNNGAVEGITVYGQTSSTWARSGPTWGIHDFAETNLDPDGSVPTAPPASWLGPNVFRGRPTVDTPRSVDLSVDVTDVCVADCETGPVAIAIQVANHGTEDIPSGVPLAIYAEESTGSRPVRTMVLGPIPAGTALDGVEVDLGPDDVGERGFRVVVDDDGAGHGLVEECDETNNTALEDSVGCG